MHVLLLLAGIVVGLFLPGFLINRLLARKNDFGASFIISTVLLFQVIFLTGLSGMRISLLTVGAALVMLDVALAYFCVRRGVGLGLDFGGKLPQLGFSMPEMIAMLPIGLAIILLFLKSSVFTLPLCDQLFRWYFLPQLMLEHGTFSFYPPLTAADFDKYAFVDLFPPIISFTYYWLYALVGKPEYTLHCIPVTLQFVLIFWYGYRLSSMLFNSRTAGVFTLLLLGSSTLLFYSLVICQETGLTALAMLACVYYLARSKSGESVADIAIAAIAVSAGALSREYGGIFVIFGLLAMAWQKFPPKKIAIYLALCSLLVAPWYLRTLILTGNPFYSLAFLGLPVNQVHIGMIDAHYDVLGLKTYMTPRVIWPLLSGLTIVLALPCIPGLISIFMSFRRLGYFLVISAVMFSLLLYHIIIPAGLFHAMRMLSPMIVLLAVCGSYLFLVAVERYRKAYVPLVAAMSLICAITFIQDIFAPFNPLSLRTEDLLVASCIAPDPADKFGDFFEKTKDIPDGSRILTDDAAFHYAITTYKDRSRRIRVVSVCSPEVGFLFEKEMGFEEANARLGKLGIRYVLVGLKDNIQFLYLRKFKFFSAYPANSKRIAENFYELPPVGQKQKAETKSDQ